MKVDITFDNLYMILSSDYPQELSIMRTAFTREVANSFILQKKGFSDQIHKCFMNEYNMVPIGLWLDLVKTCKENNIYLEMSQNFHNYINSFQMEFDGFKSFVDEMFKAALIKNKKGEYVPFKPYDYQVTAAYQLLKYKKCCAEISTSAGKTLISYIIFKYLLSQGCKKMLYIVPSKDLAVQSNEKFIEYENCLAHTDKWESGILKSGLKKAEKAKVNSCNVLFATFQSLNHKDAEFFNDFDICLCDEAHHSGTSLSIKKILVKCVNLKYSFGVTGTFPKRNKFEYLTIQSFIGPLVYMFTTDQLINVEKKGTPIYIIFQRLNYASMDDKKTLYLLRANKDQADIRAGSKVLNYEQKWVNDQYSRLKYIADMGIKTKKNTLILFGDIKGGYGKKIFEYIKENSEKNVYYIDGSTPETNRNYYKQCMEDDTSGNTVLVASINTTGEGIDIKNLWTIFLVNTAKSERLVRQICGRGIRQYPGKERVIIFDFVDDLRYTEDREKKYRYNYLWKHYKERETIYKQQNFPIIEQTINFNKTGLF